MSRSPGPMLGKKSIRTDAVWPFALVGFHRDSLDSIDDLDDHVVSPSPVLSPTRNFETLERGLPFPSSVGQREPAARRRDEGVLKILGLTGRDVPAWLYCTMDGNLLPIP